MKRLFSVVVLLFSALFFQSSLAVTSITSCGNLLSTASETYTLDANITDSSYTYCLNITAANVVLDCQGNWIDGSDTSSTYGVLVSSVSNSGIIIKNCNVTDWHYGINVRSSSGVRVENNTLSSITASSDGRAIHLQSGGSNIVRFNNVSGSTYGIIIVLYGSGSNNNNITENNVSTISNTGIYVERSTGN